ncbi:TRAP transporter small permease subunit [Aquabacterium lacunae]|uniref:TRAP transporter small permease protein n=1 Tax=Aquabacterium lacunae TaxID=2528630 RepID=A0A4Q9H1E3_9BURK|nr:TRAP transporter small permease subunit [Aquabacterium lacunae]TBO32361.1 TRAP transporter small permease subunit [Aquabacterium lacunae]
MQAFIRLIDGLSRALGVLAAWALLLACAISAGNAVLRYAFSIGSNAWLEAQWYLFALAVMAGAPMLLRLNEHVRVDVVYGGREPRTRAWIDALGLLFVLLPVCALVVHLSWQFALDSYHQHELSPSAGGLIRWPVKMAIPVGFALLALQGLAEFFKRVQYLRGQGVDLPQYERPLQ